MKKSEMIYHLASEIQEAVRTRQFSNETEEAYWKRKSRGILDMQLGFGMLAPYIDKIIEKHLCEVNEWEKE